MSDTATLPPEEELKPAHATWPRPAANPLGRRKRRLSPGADRTCWPRRSTLRRQIQRVAEQRRALPPGPVAKDYRFLDEQGNEIGLVDLFGRHDTLFAYFWMYGPERERPCPMCTSFVGSLDIPAPDIEQRLAIAIVGRSPVARQLAFARERGWRNLKFYQTVGDDYGRDDACGDRRRRGRRRSSSGGATATRSACSGRPRAAMETADPGFDPHLRARSHAALDHPRLDARGAREGLVSEARLPRLT